MGDPNYFDIDVIPLLDLLEMPAEEFFYARYSRLYDRKRRTHASFRIGDMGP